MLPGIYYLEEIKAPEGYYGYDELIMLEIKLNQKTVIVVENYEKQDEKPNETPQEENEILVGNKNYLKQGFKNMNKWSGKSVENYNLFYWQEYREKI